METLRGGRAPSMVLAGCMLALGACSATEPAPVGVAVESVHDEGLFELDRNAVGDPAVEGDDWDDVNLPLPDGDGGDSFDHTGVLPDGNGQTIFRGGGSKDDLDIGAWRHRASGPVPDKDDITNAYAAAYIDEDSNDTILYFGMDRVDTSGDANMGFWFFQQSVTPNADGTFSGNHTDGDLLVQIDYSNGGTVPNVRVLVWRADGSGEINGTLDLFFEGSADCLSPSQDTVCATTNLLETASPWLYVQKGENADGPFPPRAFVEGGINITEVFSDAENGPPCFSSFMATTRASTSVDAVLKDWVLGEFEACGIEITTSCTDGVLNEAGTAFVYDYEITVTNVGGGTLYDVTITDDLSGDVTVLPNPLGATPVTIDGSYETTEQEITVSASVTAAAVAGGAVVASDETGADSAVCEADTAPAITVSKVCTPRLEVRDNEVVVVIDGSGQVCNTGDTPLTAIVVTDDCGSGASQTDEIPDLAPGACAPWSVECTPTESNPDPVEASFSDTASVTGTPTIGSTTPVTDSSDLAVCALCPEPTPG
ncbi:hypothetical protein [Sandaracinus amylolyticus]|uniref:hypothetical protein n=1 Tax=Sandaracinus amylolyticus TaxID=927083 RepID=UPI001F32C8D6|nr:hypothetical protein [Sandaracinus amylolyticus]UJR79924.1 Hypothetical protein I5071_19640 [Sandaracinus amylolyticus]